MNTFMLSAVLALATVGIMFAFMAGGIYKLIGIALLIIAILYFFIIRVQNKIRQIHEWRGKTTGVITTSHPGGWMQVDGNSIYRESYIEYQFQHAGKTYTSTCVEPIFDNRGTRKPNLSKAEIDGLQALTMVLKASKPFQVTNLTQNQNDFDSNDEADVMIRKIYDTCNVGDEITVYYDINNPTQSVLVRRKFVRSAFKFNAGYLIILSLVLFFTT